MDEFLERYNDRQKGIIYDYWNLIRWTRRHGRISDNIKLAEMDYWSRFEPDIVIAALETHMQNYPKVKETYTRGIMRNMAEQKAMGVCTKKPVNVSKNSYGKANGFTQYEKREWDYDKLMRQEQIYIDKQIEKGE